MTTATPHADADHTAQRPGLRLGPHAPRQSRLRVRCPHCNSFARARSSDLLTPTYIEVRFECSNDACGHVWVAGLEALRTLCPSEQPNPTVHLPLTAAIRQALGEPTPASAG